MLHAATFSPCWALQVTGEFLRNGEKLNCTLSGTWDNGLHVIMPNGSKQQIWHTCAMPTTESR